MRASVVAAGLMLCAGAAAAEPLTGKEARSMLFAPGKADVEMLAGADLPDDQMALLKTVGAQQAYYGAIAISPDEGIMAEATVAAANYHSTEAASAAALAGCDAKRTGATPCAVVALIRPAKWKAEPLALSAAATEAFRKDYGRRGPRALAVSARTGGWGLGQGEGAADAALAACATSGGGARDCALAVAD